ncbi:MAG: glycosidase [Nakamurella sp.]
MQPTAAALPAPANNSVPYTLTRVGVVMEPEPDNPNEIDGVLNPATGRDSTGAVYLLPRLVAAGNVSRVGRAKVLITDGVPNGVEREAVVLSPDRGWERANTHGGVEDPRVTWIEALGTHVMTYVAYGPLGPRPAIALSLDLRTWTRLGPIHFEFDDTLDLDLNLCSNKDVVFFPAAVPGPDGRPAFAALHRPTWDLDVVAPGLGEYLPAGATDNRPGIWISYLPVDDVISDIGALTHFRMHRQVALSQFDFEAVKVGAGPPPLRIPEGWLLIHHGVAGRMLPGTDHQPFVHYAAGAMILSADDPAVVLARTSEPLLSAELAEEKHGIVPNVVFPTAIEKIDGKYYVFYGMADSRIGVARLDRIEDAG